MLQERSHVNYVWQKMRQELPTRDVATNYMEVVTCDYEYSMHIILMRRHDFLASAFFEHNFDERNANHRPWIRGIYHDDKQVTTLFVKKRYAERPRVEVRIRRDMGD